MLKKNQVGKSEVGKVFAGRDLSSGGKVCVTGDQRKGDPDAPSQGRPLCGLIKGYNVGDSEIAPEENWGTQAVSPTLLLITFPFCFIVFLIRSSNQRLRSYLVNVFESP